MDKLWKLRSFWSSPRTMRRSRFSQDQLASFGSLRNTPFSNSHPSRRNNIYDGHRTGLGSRSPHSPVFRVCTRPVIRVTVHFFPRYWMFWLVRVQNNDDERYDGWRSSKREILIFIRHHTLIQLVQLSMFCTQLCSEYLPCSICQCISN